MPTGPLVPNEKGTDFNHWQRISGITNTSFEEGPDLTFRFKGSAKDIILTLEGSVTVIYSFNGNTEHGELIASSDRSQVVFRRRPASMMWFKVVGGTGACTVEAWASV